MKKRTGREVAKVEPSADVAVARRFGDELVAVEAVYHVRELRPSGDGPWSTEADKIAWTDPMTGFGCIIRRSSRGGHLCGYVGVAPDHPLFGFRPAALAGLGLHAHGGIVYADGCRDRDPEDRSICHVSRSVVLEGVRQEAFENREARRHDDRWWFGFECDQPYDVLPDHPLGYARQDGLDGVNRRVYRDEAYVHGECRRLAAQLKAIGDGDDPAEAAGPPRPVLGYDPRMGRR